MSCRKIRKRLALHAGGDLDPLARAEVEVHLRNCLACYRELVSLREVLESVRKVGREGASLEETGGARQFTAAVMAEVATLPPPRRLRRLVVPWVGWAAAAAVLMLVLVRDRLWSPAAQAPSDSAPPVVMVDMPPITMPGEDRGRGGGLRLIDEGSRSDLEMRRTLERLRREGRGGTRDVRATGERMIFELGRSGDY